MNSLAFDNVVAIEEIEERNSVSVAILETDRYEEDIETLESFDNNDINANFSARQFTDRGDRSITTTTVAYTTSEIRNATNVAVNNTNENGYDKNEANINMNEAGIITNDEVDNTIEAGININEAGININDAGINTNDAGINIHEAGVYINDAGININEAGVYKNEAVIITNEIDNNNKAGIGENAIESNTFERDRDEHGDTVLSDNSLFWNMPGLQRDKESDGLMHKVFDAVENENNLVLLELQKIAAERENNSGNETKFWN